MPEPESMPTVLEHWRHPFDLYNQSAYGPYSVAAWLPRLGPVAWLLWSTLASQVYVHGTGVIVDLAEVAESLGISPHRGLPRSLKRLRDCRLVKPVAVDDPALQVRIYAPPAGVRAFEKMAPATQQMHLDIFGVRTTQVSGLAASQ
jgi:hypothetical protein